MWNELKKLKTYYKENTFNDCIVYLGSDIWHKEQFVCQLWGYRQDVFVGFENIRIHSPSQV